MCGRGAGSPPLTPRGPRLSLGELMKVHDHTRPHKKNYGVLLSLQACSCKAAKPGVVTDRPPPPWKKGKRNFSSAQYYTPYHLLGNLKWPSCGNIEWKRKSCVALDRTGSPLEGRTGVGQSSPLYSHLEVGHAN